MKDPLDPSNGDANASRGGIHRGRCSSPENELRDRVERGQEVRRGRGDAASEGHTWGDDRKLRAELLYELLGRPRSSVKPRAAVLVGLRITGHLNLEAVELRAPLIAHGCYFDEPVNLMAATASQIRFTACHLPALAGDGLETHGDLDLSDSSLAVLGLVRAHIGGDLLLRGTTLGIGQHPVVLGDGALRPSESPVNKTNDVALVAERLKVDGAMACDRGFSAQGQVRIPSVHIGGELTFSGASLLRDVDAGQLHVEGPMFLDRQFNVGGHMNLLGARVGELVCKGGVLAKGLDATELQVAADVFCDEGFSADGNLCLVAASVGGMLRFDDATLNKTRTLDLTDASVVGELVLAFLTAPAEITLTRARVGGLWDDEAIWPSMRIRGFVYSGFGSTSDVRHRLRWISIAEAIEGYSPEPYTQLMAFFAQEGRDSDRRKVAFERERRRAGKLGRARRAWSSFLRFTVGYGYKPMRALAWLGVLVGVGTIIFSRAHNAGDLQAINQEHPPFVAILYTLDRLVPVISIGLRDAFAPSGAAQWCAFAYTVLGWALTIAVAAGLNATVRRD